MKNLLHLILFLAAVTAASCGSTTHEKNEKNRKLQAAIQHKDSLALKIAVTPTLDCLPIFVAASSGIFDQIGVIVSLKEMNAQMDCDEAIREEKVECMVSDLMRTERLKRTGIEMTYLTATGQYWQLIGNRKGRVTTIAQMGDKMVAMTRYSATDYLATLAIDSVKPDNPVFRIQINDVLVRLKMLINNEMDAVMLPEPHATTARLSHHPVMMDSRGRDIRLGVIAARTKVLSNPYRKKQMELFIQAYNMACDSIHDKGLQHYSPVIKTYCHTDDATVKSLPPQTFNHAAQPRQKDIDRTKNVSWRMS